MNELERIRQFLESLNYQFDNSNIANVGYLYTHLHENGWTSGGNTEKEALKRALGHFLVGELGRKWQQTWDYLEQGGGFDQQEIATIQTAIQFYEALEAEIDPK